MIAEYLAIDNETLHSLQQLDDAQLTDEVINLLESGQNPHVDLGKLWDVMHFVLTKQSATAPLLDSPLSEFVLGAERFNDTQDADFIAYTDWATIAEIIDTLEQINFDKRLEKLELKTLREARIFPEKIWQDKKSNLIKELMISFKELKTLYTDALDNGNNVIVSIL